VNPPVVQACEANDLGRPECDQALAFADYACALTDDAAFEFGTVDGGAGL